MSNYLNIPDFVPQLQPFDPTLNFYAGVLATKQGQYEQGLSKINSIYSSVFNSPMSRQDNIARRDQYFKTVEQSVKKVAGTDLSMDQNVSAAQTLFDPLLNDKDIVNDMVKTKAWHSALETGDQYRNCIDPEKCGGSYWDEGMQKIQYEIEDFKNASPEDAMRMQTSKYTPKIDVQKKAFAAIKDAKFDISSEYVKGGYNITDTNGYLLLGKADKNGNKVSNGILPQFLYGMFGNDSAVQEMYKTQAYVHRKGMTKQIAREKGISEQQAESEYLHSMLPQASLNLEKSKADLVAHSEKLKVDSDALEIVAKDKGYGDSVEEAYAKIQELRKNIAPAEAYHEGVSNLIKSAPNLNDVNALRNRVDGIVANSNFIHHMDSVAYEYAMGTAKHKMEENKYSLAAFNNKLDLNKSLQLKQFDHELRLDLESKLGHIVGPNKGQDVLNVLAQKGLSMSDLAPLGIDATNINTPAAHKLLLKSGLFTNEEAKASGLAFATGGENTTDANLKNAKVFGRAVDEAHDASSAFVKATVKDMQAQYKQAGSDPDKTRANTIQNKILNDASDFFKGSGINVQDLLSGNTSLDVLNNHPKLGDVTDMMLESRKKDKSSLVYNSGWKDTDIMNLQIAQQSAQGLMKEREGIMKNAVKEVILGMPDKSHVVEESGKFASMIGEGGQVLPVMDAFKKYWTTTPHSGDIQKEMAHYVIGYNDRYKTLVGKMKSLDSKAGSQDVGGSTGVGSSIVHNISGDAKYSTDFITFKNTLEEAKGNPAITILGGDSKDFADFKESPSASTLANFVINKVTPDDGDTKGMKLTTQTQYLPQNGMVGVKVTVNDDETVREAMGLKKTDPITEPMRTFVVALPENSAAGNKFISRTELRPSDALLQNEGRSISVEFPEKGSGTVYNKGGKLYGRVKAVDYDSDSGYVTIYSPQALPTTNVEKAFAIVNNNINDYYLKMQTAHLKRLKLQKQNAQSGKN